VRVFIQQKIERRYQMSTAITEKKQSPVAAFSGFMEQLKPQIARALPAHMNADRMARLALTAFSTTPALQECDPKSIAGAIMAAAQIGLEPGINGQGYLIPYKTTCTFVPGWKGLVDLVSRSGRATVWTGAVRDGDKFDYQLGDEPFCKHRPGDEDDDAPFTHVYAIGRVKDAAMPVIEVWSRAKVLKHLAKYNKVGNRHYAKTDENNLEMYARKCALLQVLKYMPSSIELANAIVASHAAEEGHGVTIENGIIVEVEKQSTEKELPECTPEKFADIAREWEPMVRSGKKKAAQAIAAIRTVATLTEEQEFQINAWAQEGN
jgi:recombination protein RecT